MENTRDELSKLRKIIYKSKVNRFTIASSLSTNNFNIYKSKTAINNNLKHNIISKENENKDDIYIDGNLIKAKKKFVKNYTGYINKYDGKETVLKDNSSCNIVKYLNDDKKSNIYFNPRNHLNTVNIAEKNLNQKNENQKKCKSNNHKKSMKNFNQLNKNIKYTKEIRSDNFDSTQFNNTNKKIELKQLQPTKKNTENRNSENLATYNKLNIHNFENKIILNTENQGNIYKDSLNNNKNNTVVNSKKYYYYSPLKIKNENNQVDKNVRNNKLEYNNSDNDNAFYNPFNNIYKTVNNLYDSNISKCSKWSPKEKSLNTNDYNSEKNSNLNFRNYFNKTKLTKNKIKIEVIKNFLKNSENFLEDTVSSHSNKNSMKNRVTKENSTPINFNKSTDLANRCLNKKEILNNLNHQKTLTESEKLSKKTLQLKILDKQKFNKFTINNKNNESEKALTAKSTKKSKKIYSKPLKHKLSLLYFSSNIIKADNSIININERYTQKYPNDSSRNSIIIQNINNIKDLINNDNFKYSKRNITPKIYSRINSKTKKKIIKSYSEKEINNKVVNIKQCFCNKLCNYYIRKYNNIICYISKVNKKNVKIYGEKQNHVYFLPRSKLCYFSKTFDINKNYKSFKINTKEKLKTKIENNNNSNKKKQEKIKISDPQESKEEIETNFEHKSDYLSTIINNNNTFSLLTNNDSSIKNEIQDKKNFKNIVKNIQNDDESIPFNDDAYLFSLFKDDFLLETNNDKVVTEGKLVSTRNIKIHDMENLERGLIILKKIIKNETSKICFSFLKRYKNITDIKKIVENKKYNVIMRRNFDEFTLNNKGNYCRFTKEFVNKNSNLYLPVKNSNQENKNTKFITPTKKNKDNRKIFFSPHFKIIKTDNLENTQENYINPLDLNTDAKNNKKIDSICIKAKNNPDNDNIKKKTNTNKLYNTNDQNICPHNKIIGKKKKFSYGEIIFYNQKNRNYCYYYNILPKNIIEHCNNLTKIKEIKICDEKSKKKEVLFLLNIITENNFSLILKKIVKLTIFDINIQNIFLKLIINRINKEKLYIKLYAKCCSYLNKKIRNNTNLQKKKFNFDNNNSFINKIKIELFGKFDLIIKYSKDKKDFVNFIDFVITLIELNVLSYDLFFNFLDRLYEDYSKNNNYILLESIINIINNINKYNIKDQNQIKNIIHFFKDKIQPILKNTKNFSSYLKYNCINAIEKYNNDNLLLNIPDNKHENNHQYLLNNKQINEALYNIYRNHEKEKNIKKLLIYDIQNYIKSKKVKAVNYNWFIIDEIIFDLHVEINTIIFYYIYACQSIGVSDKDIKYSNEYFDEILNYFLKYSLDNQYINKIMHTKIIDVFSEICNGIIKINTINIKISYVFYSLLKFGIIKIDDFCYFSNKNEETKKNFRNIINGVIALCKSNKDYFLDSLQNFDFH